MKLAFWRQAQTNFAPNTSIPCQIGVPVSCGSTINEHLSSMSLVGNLGNMVHRMAMIQMLDFDRTASSQINLYKLIEYYNSPKTAAKILNRYFDGLVITFSNIISHGNTEHYVLVELIRELKIPIFALGIGLQESLTKGDSSMLNKAVIELVSTLDDKAALFGVRGHGTKSYLNSIGIKNAEAIGCPSMFAYPKNILSITYPCGKVNKIISAGHLTLRQNTINNRFAKLVKGFHGAEAAYVFQSGLQTFEELLNVDDIYNHATQTINAEVINAYLKQKFNFTSNFYKYYSFCDTSSWRQAYTSYDVYAGDRIHGGVIMLQIGKPALIIHNDARVRELTSYHGIPSCSLDEFEKIGCHATLEKYYSKDSLDKFHERYYKALMKFNKYIKQSGLKLLKKFEI
ncbi:MAG: polysaccharide pyruvyl transferase family protein [Campylobacteraceae bacterium]|jgi:hypothetical protein|nr:polysaccharide pyruvyl transferase family protein [Campylobacteraceae bacterium]